MKKTVSAMEARRKFGELLEDASRGDHIIIERAGRVMGVLVSPDEFQIMEQNRERLFKFFEDAWERTRGIPAAEVEREVERAIRDVRSRRATKSKRSA
jgi:prevent-host-death family protein